MEKIFTDLNSGNIRIHWQRDSISIIGWLEGSNKVFLSLILLGDPLSTYDGLSVLRKIRAPSSPHRITPVVALSQTMPDTKVLRDFWSTGLNSWVEKPADQATLHKTVKIVGEFWLNHAILPEYLPTT